MFKKRKHVQSGHRYCFNLHCSKHILKGVFQFKWLPFLCRKWQIRTMISSPQSKTNFLGWLINNKNLHSKWGMDTVDKQALTAKLELLLSPLFLWYIFLIFFLYFCSPSQFWPEHNFICEMIDRLKSFVAWVEYLYLFCLYPPRIPASL